jgi:16S rRNA (cytidine1402-2'-O)-methyltransferase
LNTDHVLFLGFLPRKAGARRQILEAQIGRSETLVLFESPRRVAATAAEMAAILGDRRASLARELTKKHEEVIREPLSVLASRYADEAPRGECTLVVAGASAEEAIEARAWLDEDVDAAIQIGLASGESTKDLASDLAKKTGRPKRALYARAVELRAESEGGA